jgi:hypothetical protein
MAERQVLPGDDPAGETHNSPRADFNSYTPCRTRTQVGIGSCLRTPEDAANNRPGAQVPIEVEPGYPVVLEHIQFSDDFARIMVLGRYRALLEQARKGASGLIGLRDSLLELPETEKWVSASCTDLQSVANWSAALLKVLDQHDPLKSVLGVNQDFLGIYDYDSRALFVDEQAINRVRSDYIGASSDWSRNGWGAM